ncbi:MAG TPA: MFS transporter [Verrucomicrobiae bacterium]|nr:MFS transporter [Verrucomicrobiae bacterium]
MFLVESWLEHLRQHDRVTRADRKLEERVHQFVLEEPRVTHLITAEPGHELKKWSSLRGSDTSTK